MRVRVPTQYKTHQQFFQIAHEIEHVHTVPSSPLRDYCLFEGIEHGLMMGLLDESHTLLARLDVSTWRIENLQDDYVIQLFRMFDWDVIHESWLTQLESSGEWKNCKPLTVCAMNQGYFESAYELCHVYLQNNDNATHEGLSIQKSRAESLYHMGEGDEAFEELSLLKESMSDEMDIAFRIAVIKSLAVSAEDPSIAIPLLKEVQDLLEQSDASLEERLDNQAEIANQYHRFGDLDESLRLFEAVVAYLEEEDDGYDFRSHRYNLGQLYMTVGRHEEGWELLLDVLDECQSILGPAHPRTMFVCSELASLHLAHEEPQEAIALLEESWSQAYTLLGFGHPETLLLGVCFANTYIEERQDFPKKWYDAYQLWLQEEFSLHSKLSDGRHRVWSVGETNSHAKAQHVMEIALGKSAESLAQYLSLAHLSEAFTMKALDEIRWWCQTLGEMFVWVGSEEYEELLESFFYQFQDDFDILMCLCEAKGFFLHSIESEDALPFLLSSLSSVRRLSDVSDSNIVSAYVHVFFLATKIVWEDDWLKEEEYSEQFLLILEQAVHLIQPCLDLLEEDSCKWWHQSQLNLAQIYNEFDDAAPVSRCFEKAFAILDQGNWADEDTKIESHYKLSCFLQEQEEWENAQKHLKIVLEKEEEEYGLDSRQCLSTITDLLYVSSEMEDEETIERLLSMVHEHIEVLDNEDEEDADILERLQEWFEE